MLAGKLSIQSICQKLQIIKEKIVILLLDEDQHHKYLGGKICVRNSALKLLELVLWLTKKKIYNYSFGRFKKCVTRKK